MMMIYNTLYECVSACKWQSFGWLVTILFNEILMTPNKRKGVVVVYVAFCDHMRSNETTIRQQ